MTDIKPSKVIYRISYRCELVIEQEEDRDGVHDKFTINKLSMGTTDKECSFGFYESDAKLLRDILNKVLGDKK